MSWRHDVYVGICLIPISIHGDVITWKRSPHHWHFVTESIGYSSLLTRAVDVEFWCRLRLAKQIVEQTIDLPLIRDALTLVSRHCNTVFISPQTGAFSAFNIKNVFLWIYDLFVFRSATVKSQHSSFCHSCVFISCFSYKSFSQTDLFFCYIYVPASAHVII